MSVIYGDPAKQRRYDATRIIDASGHEPLQEAIACALGLRQTREKLVSVSHDPESLKSLAAVISDEFHAWIKVAEFVYAKPKQKLEVEGTVTLESLLAGTWTGDPGIPLPPLNG